MGDLEDSRNENHSVRNISFNHFGSSCTSASIPGFEMDIVAASDDEDLLPDPLDLLNNSTIRELLSVAYLV